MADTLKQTINISTDKTTQHELVPTNVDSTKTVLSFIACNIDQTNACEFDVYIYGTPTGGSIGNFRLYNQQSLPTNGTFIHNSKIVIMPNEELRFIQKQSGTASNAIHVTTTYLDQTT